jgi:hypothetical protein
VISKEAISHDLRDIYERIARSQLTDAQELIGRLVEDLDILALPQMNRRQRVAGDPQCGADEFGGQNVASLRGFCERAMEAVRQGSEDRAELCIEAARKFWDALPPTKVARWKSC